MISESEMQDDDVEEFERETLAGCSTSEFKVMTFNPIYVYGKWENDDWESRISVAVLLPSGTGRKNENHRVEVSEDGKICM